MRSSHVKRLNFNKGLSSTKVVVATDIALANIEKIEKNELVSKWILAEGSRTVGNSSEHDDDIHFSRFHKNNEDNESFVRFIEDGERSPVLECNNRTEFVDVNKSPIIGNKNKKIKTRNGISKAGEKSKASLDKRKRDPLASSDSPSDKSPILGNSIGTLNSIKKCKQKIKRRKLEDSLDSEKDPEKEEKIVDFSSNENQTQASESRIDNNDNKIKIEDIETGQKLFEEQRITASPNDVWNIPIKTERNEDLFCSEVSIKDEKLSPQSWTDFEEYHPSPVMKRLSKKEKNVSEFKKLEESFIRNTEPFSLAYDKKHNNKNLISEFSVERRTFITDTERIDYDTDSETEDVKHEIFIAKVESDSDKTVSDIIEEPMTQEYVEPLISNAVSFNPKLKTVSALSKNTISSNSPKISEAVSPTEQNSPDISIVNISVENTPPRLEPEEYSFTAANLDSGKKKKSKPKKGSLSARLQKLISGKISSIRLWRHQMSRESLIERSSAPCTTLLVIKKWREYGKDLYESKILDDPYDLLNNCSAQDRESENLVVMTNPDFVGSVKLSPGTVFRIYLPWEIFKPNLSTGSYVLHALYFNVASNSCDIKSEIDNSDEHQVCDNRNQVLCSKVIREFDCPCLKNGKIDNHCLSKFTNHKIDVIEEIFK